MTRAGRAVIVGSFCIAVFATMSGVRSARAHCDTMSGPIIPEARAALDQGDVTPVLKWIKPEHEAELKAAFESTLRVRSLDPEAMALADRYFLETLVRLHREGEGAPYSGLKDTPPGEIVARSDEALASGSADRIVEILQKQLAAAIQTKFEAARQASKSMGQSVSQGREYVEAYVQYMHYVEGLHAAIASPGTHEGEAPEGHGEPGTHDAHGQ